LGVAGLAELPVASGLACQDATVVDQGLRRSRISGNEIRVIIVTRGRSAE